MEKAPHEEYRDDLADKLNKIRNSNPEKPEIAKAIAKGYLEATKNNLDYRENRDDDEDGMLEGSRFYRVQKARWEKILPKLMEKQAIELKEYNYKLDTLKRDPVIGYLFESAQVIPDGDNLEFNTDKFDRNGNFVSKGLRFEVSLNKRIEIKGSTKEKEDIFFMEKEKEIVEYLDKLLKNADRIPNWLLKLYKTGKSSMRLGNTISDKTYEEIFGQSMKPLRIINRSTGEFAPNSLLVATLGKITTHVLSGEFNSTLWFGIEATITEGERECKWKKFKEIRGGGYSIMFGAPSPTSVEWNNE